MPSESDSRLRSGGGYRALLAVLLVAAVGVATIGMPVVNSGMTTTAEAAESPEIAESYDSVSQVDSERDPADEVYLGENGSAVLQYDDDEGDVNQIDLGMDVSEGLAYMLVVDDIEDQDEEFQEANFSAVLDQSGFSGDGSFVMEQPEEVENFELDASGEVTDETNEFEATATGTFESQGGAAGTVDTDGQITATADRFETSGSVSADGAAGAMTGANSEGESLDLSLNDTSDGYTLDVTQERGVYDWSASQWETREQAEQTLQQQYGSLATDLGGTSEIEISNYNFEERSSGQHKLELEFTVEYTGIDDGIEQQLTTVLANSEEYDLSQSEAAEVAGTVTDLEIQTFEFSMATSGGSMDAEWDIAIDNYGELSLAMIDLAEASSMSEEMAQEDLEDARTALEAQQAVDLQSEIKWSASVEQTSDQKMELDAELSSNTENWAAYIDELEANDVDPQNDVSFSLTANTDGDELAVDAQFEIEAEDMASQAINSWANSVQNNPTTMSSDTDEFMTALSESELEVARVDGNIADGTVRVEGGAKFENMSKVADTFSDSVSISGMASGSAGNSTSLYVYVDDMGVDTESATKSDIEHLDVVGSETTVHEAGEWDEEFPEPDTDAMSEYLGVASEKSSESNESGDGDGGSDTVPGFGVGVTAIAGLLTALVLRRQA
ncbi:hypothetical protein [Natrinema longum]|uniref:hypothetical protein n=1 Tax=Natrinema longum TaxID=370324 RepID=UPI001CCBFCDA|nr:hypothetical protein [Natrinema longum]